jgi:hypothetical protein
MCDCNTRGLGMLKVARTGLRAAAVSAALGIMAIGIIIA